MLDDTEFYDSNTYKDLKQSLNVIDSDGKQYEPEEFQIKGADESDRLPYGSLNVVVVINGNEVSLDENISVNRDVLNEISVSVNETIYASDSAEEVAEKLTVTGIFQYIGEDDDSLEATVSSWNQEVGDNSITVSVVFNSKNVDTTVDINVVEKKVVEIMQVDSSGLPESVDSSTEIQDLKDYLIVNAEFEDGSTGILDKDEYTIVGSLVVAEESATNVTLYVSIPGNDEVEDKEFTVTVSPVEPVMLLANITSEHEFTAYDDLGDIRSNLSVSVIYQNASYVIPITNYVVIEDSPGLSINPEKLPDQTTISLEQSDDDVLIHVYAQVSGEILHATVDITVNYFELKKPQLSGSPNVNYDALPDERVIIDFDDEYMKIQNASNGLKFSNNTVSATDVGTHSFTVQLNDPDNCRWEDGTQEGVQLSWTIMPASLDAIDLTITGWTYSPDFSETDFRNYCTISVQTTGIQWAEENNGDIQFQYYGVKANGVVVGNMNAPVEGFPTDAGTWHVRGVIPESAGKNFVGTGNFSNVTIVKAIVPSNVVTIDSATYNGVQQPMQYDISQDYSNILSIPTIKRQDADTYDVIVTITSDYSNNYCWDPSNPNVTEKTYKWTIERCPVELKTIYSASFTGDDVIVTIAMDSAFSISVNGEGLSLDDSTLTISNATVGNYTVVATLNDSDNYCWKDGTASVSRVITVFVTQASNSVSVSVNGWTYSEWDAISNGISVDALFGADTAIISIAKKTDGVGQTEASYTDIGPVGAWNQSHIPTEAGDYWIRVIVNSTSNYDEAVGYSSFTITPDENDIGVSIQGWVYSKYDGSLNSPIANATHGIDYIQYSYAIRGASDSDGSDNMYSEDVPENAGLYWLKAYIPGTSNYLEKAVYVQFEIERMGIDAPDVEYPESGNVYTGEAISVNTGVHVEYTVVSGNIQTDAGNHAMVVSPTSNYKWADLKGEPAVSSREISWEIERRPISPEGGRSLEYDDGNPLVPAITASYNGAQVGFTPSFATTSAINEERGYYTGTLTLTNTNFKWAPSNLSYIVDGEVVVSDQVSNDGKDITIWYRITQEQYTLTIEIQGGSFDYTSGTPTYTYDGSFPEVSIGEGVAITSVLPDEVESSNKTLYIVDSAGNIMGEGDSANVGTYSVYLVIDETEHYAQGESNHATFHIVKANIGITSGLADGEGTYTGKALSSVPTEPVLSIVSGNDYDITYSVSENGNYDEDVPKFTGVRVVNGKVSGYVVYYQIESYNYNTLKGSFTFTVNPAEVTLDITPWTDIEYTGSEPVLDGAGHWRITSGLDNGDDLDLSFTTDGVIPGTHDVTCKSDNTNYIVIFEGDQSCTIVNADMILVGNFTGYSGQYDGVSHDVVVESPTIKTINKIEPTIRYSWSYSDDVFDYADGLTIKDVPDSSDNTVPVYYVITADHHNNKYGNFKVTVSPKSLTLIVNDTTVEYGNAPQFTVTYDGFVNTDSPDDLLKSISYNHSYVAGESNSGDVIDVSIVDSFSLGNYDITKNAGKLTVTDRVLTISMKQSSYEYEYDEQPSEIPQSYDIVKGSIFGDDVNVFTIVAMNNNGDEESPALDVGVYSLVPDVVDSNYTIKMQSSVSYTITATTLEINFSAYTATYDGTQKVITANASGHDDIEVGVTYYEVVNGTENKLTEAPTDVGTYRVKASIVSTPNYTAGSASIDMGITKATIVVSSSEGVSLGMSFSGSGSQYTGSALAPTLGGQVILSGVRVFEGGEYVEGSGIVLNATDVLSADFSYYKEDGTTPVERLEDAGTYKVAVTLKLNETFERNFVCPPNPGMQTFIIEKRELQVTWEDMNFDYLGQNGVQSLAGIVSFSDGEESYAPWYTLYIVDGTDRVELTSDNFVDAGTYTLDVELTDYNYDLQSHSTRNYTIDPLQISISAKPVNGVIFGELGVNDNLDAYNGYVTSGDANAISIFTSEASSYAVSFSVRPNLSGNGDHVIAGTHEDAILISYSGSANFDVTVEPGDLTVSQRTVHIDVLDQEYDYTGSPIEPSSDPRCYVVDPTESLGLNLGVRIIHGTEGVASGHSIMDYGSHSITCIVTNKNYTVAYTDSSGASLDGILKVNTAENNWIPDDESGIEGWVFGDSPGVDGVDFPSSIFGTVTATIYDDDNEISRTFTASEVESVDFGSMSAGQYTIVYSVAAPESLNFTGLTGISAKTHTFEIDQKPLRAWWADEDGEDRFVYDPNISHTVQLHGYDSTLMSIGDIDSNHPHVEADGKVTMTEVEGDTYGVVLTITDDNYCWYNLSGDVNNVTWVISSIGENGWDILPSIDDTWEYGEEIEYVAGVAKHGGTATVTFYYSSGAEYGPQPPTDIGSYYMLASVAETGSYDGIELQLDFSITKKTLVKPDIEATTFAYNGGETVIFDVESYGWYSGLDGYVTYSGNTGAQPGKYSLVLYLNNTYSTSWDDGSVDPLIVEWTISDAGEIDESMFNVEVSSSVFSGHPEEKNVESTNLVEGEDYVVSYTNNTSAGTASIVITGIGAYSGQLQYEFQIQRASEQPSFYNEALTMYVEDDAFYNAVQIPAYVDSSKVAYVSSDSDIATVDSSTGAIVMNATGTVTITAYYAGTDDYTAGTASYELTVSDHPVEVVDHVVYVKVPVEVPDDDDDQTDDKPETVYIEKDNDLYIWLLIVMAVICVCFAAYILYSHRDQEGGA